MERLPQIIMLFKPQKWINPSCILNNRTFILSSMILFALSFFSCKKDNDSVKNEVSAFVLSSPEIGPDSLLPSDYTCDGESATLPLEWSGFPESAQRYHAGK
jgi:hypothetical protein